MNTDDDAIDQLIDNVVENPTNAAEIGKIKSFFPGAILTACCAICGADFQRGRGSSASSCSEPCRRERRLRYGATYRQHFRDERKRLLAMFEGRHQTDEELLKLLEQPKDKP